VDRPSPFGDAKVLNYARFLLDARRRRDEAFPALMFRDHTWSILVDLYVAVEEGKSLSLSDLYSAVQSPKATVLRSISRLVTSGVLRSEEDCRDGRRTFVRLSQGVHSTVHKVLGDELERLNSRP
jgi:DNA-binding MarR family transcriptional regulator